MCQQDTTGEDQGASRERIWPCEGAEVSLITNARIVQLGEELVIIYGNPETGKFNFDEDTCGCGRVAHTA